MLTVAGKGRGYWSARRGMLARAMLDRSCRSLQCGPYRLTGHTARNPFGGIVATPPPGQGQGQGPKRAPLATARGWTAGMDGAATARAAAAEDAAEPRPAGAAGCSTAPDERGEHEAWAAQLEADLAREASRGARDGVGASRRTVAVVVPALHSSLTVYTNHTR